MGAIEWAMWGNEQGVGSACVLILGGILAVVGQFKRSEIGAFAIILGVFIGVLEYPRSDRRRGGSKERRFQSAPSLVVKLLGPFGRNYYVRFVVYLLTCVPCVFQVSTVLGAISLLFTSLIYLKAALNGEKWIIHEDTTTKSRASEGHDRSQPPLGAPPRLRIKEDNGVDNIAIGFNE